MYIKDNPINPFYSHGFTRSTSHTFQFLIATTIIGIEEINAKTPNTTKNNVYPSLVVQIKGPTVIATNDNMNCINNNDAEIPAAFLGNS